MQEDKKIRVILADDHQIVLDGLSFVLRDVPDIEVVGMVNDGEKVLEILRLNRDGVDVAVLDISMPVLNGIETTHKIHRMYPQVKVLILTMYGSEALSARWLSLG
ncbi:MAG: response regulator transcription factor [Bacteroidia bacterium]|nr:response regulator transcription factor [Bacteroidia bacterium]